MLFGVEKKKQNQTYEPIYIVFQGECTSCYFQGDNQDLRVGDRINQFGEHTQESGFALNFSEILKT